MTTPLPEFMDQVVTGRPASVYDLDLDGTKIGWYRERVEAWRRGELTAPITMDVAWTRKCAAACNFCIFPNSRILMADGSTKRMIDVRVGDVVVSIDDNGDHTASTVTAHWMTSPFERGLRIETALGNLKCTASHLVRTDEGWVEAGNLRIGDIVYQVTVEHSSMAKEEYALADGDWQYRTRPCMVSSLGKIRAIADAGYSPVYDLECGPYHNFVADGIVVHNCYAQLQASEDTVITRQNALDYLDDAADIGVKGVSLISDGESTEVPFFAESIEYGAKRGLQIGTSSNGVKLTPDVLERILPGLTYIRFNFSGGDKHRWAQIMGLKQPLFDRVVNNIKAAMAIKRRDNLPVNINMQFVVMPRDADQILPFARLAKEIRPDYAIMKHCANSADADLDVDYRHYNALFPVFQEAEAMSDETFRVAVKWSRIQDEGKRDYQRCYGPPHVLQMSGNGLIAPCGQKFNSKYAKFHIGNITRTRFKDIFHSERYREVLNYLASDAFNASQDCGENCLQTNSNSWLNKWVQGRVDFPTTPPPPHLGFL